MKKSIDTYGSDLDFLNAAIKHKMAKFENVTRASEWFQSGIIEGWHLHKEWEEYCKGKKQ